MYTAKSVTRDQRDVIQAIRDKAAKERREAEESHRTASTTTPKKRKATSTSTPKATPKKKSRRDPSPSSSSEDSVSMSLYSDNNSSEYSFSGSDSESESGSGSSSSGSSIGTPDDYPDAGNSDVENPSTAGQIGSFGNVKISNYMQNIKKIKDIKTNLSRNKEPLNHKAYICVLK